MEKRKKIRRVHLKSANDVRRLLSGIIHQLRSGEIESDKASKICYAANILLKALELGSLENRIRSLENVIERSN